MPGSTPPTSQLDWLISMTTMIVLFWSRATRDLLKSFGWGIAALHRLDAATKLPFPRRPPHSIFRSPGHGELSCRVIPLRCLLGRGRAGDSRPARRRPTIRRRVIAVGHRGVFAEKYRAFPCRMGWDKAHGLRVDLRARCP